MSKTKRTFPLKKRSDIYDFIKSSTISRSYGRNEKAPLCFNVKIGHADLSFENLLKIYKKIYAEGVYVENEQWLKAVKELYNENEIWEQAREDACDQFIHPEEEFYLSDCVVSVEFAFVGRSGGWLSINECEGYDFTSSDSSLSEILHEMEYEKLRKLYKLVSTLVDKCSYASRKITFEECAAFVFFENICCDVPRPDTYQPVLFEV